MPTEGDFENKSCQSPQKQGGLAEAMSVLTSVEGIVAAGCSILGSTC